MGWYLMALGSNRRSRSGSPYALIQSLTGQWPVCLSVPAPPHETVPAFARRREGTKGMRCSRIMTSVPLGPGQRRYANAVGLIASDLMPVDLLAQLKAIERAHGRRAGRRWGDRALDLDLIGWSGGVWTSRTLTIPHPAFRQRRFVLAPLVEIAARWRDPVSGLTARQLLARLDRKRPRA